MKFRMNPGFENFQCDRDFLPNLSGFEEHHADRQDKKINEKSVTLQTSLAILSNIIIVTAVNRNHYCCCNHNHNRNNYHYHYHCPYYHIIKTDSSLIKLDLFTTFTKFNQICTNRTVQKSVQFVKIAPRCKIGMIRVLQIAKPITIFSVDIEMGVSHFLIHLCALFPKISATVQTNSF